MSANASYNPIINNIVSLLLRYALRSLLVPLYLAYGAALILAAFMISSLFWAVNKVAALMVVGVFSMLLFAPSIVAEQGLGGLPQGSTSFDYNDIIYSIAFWFLAINIIADVVHYIRHRGNNVPKREFKGRYHLLVFAVLYTIVAIGMAHMNSDILVALIMFAFSALTIIPWKIYRALTRSTSRMLQM